MWALLGYPSTPAMPPGAMPLLAKLAMSQAEGLHAWEGLFRMALDAGRTEGAIVASACWLGLILVVLLTATALKVLGWLFRK